MVGEKVCLRHRPRIALRSADYLAADHCGGCSREGEDAGGMRYDLNTRECPA